MYATTREVGDVLVLGLKGLIDGGPHVDEFQDQVKRALGEGRTQILVDLKSVSYMRSQGVGMLIGAYTSVCNGGGEMKLMRPSGRVLSLLIITRINLVMDIHETEAEAIESFGEATADGVTGAAPA